MSVIASLTCPVGAHTQRFAPSASSRAPSLLRPRLLPPALHAAPTTGPRRTPQQGARASYEDAYKEIRERRAAKKRSRLAEQQGGAAAPAGETAADSDAGVFPAQTGDTVELRYSITDIASGKVVDSSEISASGAERLVKIQLGTDAGFQPKKGLMLAYNDVVTGLTVGEGAKLEVRANGQGLFRSYDIYAPSEKEGGRIGSLTADECRSEWAGKPCRVEVELVSITPPRGRERGMGRRAYASQLPAPSSAASRGGGGGPVDLTKR